MSIMELGCTVRVVSSASAMAGSALSLLSVTHGIVEAAHGAVENASAFKSRQEVFDREAFFWWVSALDLSSVRKCSGSKDNGRCALQIVFNSGLWSSLARVGCFIHCPYCVKGYAWAFTPCSRFLKWDPNKRLVFNKVKYSELSFSLSEWHLICMSNRDLPTWPSASVWSHPLFLCRMSCDPSPRRCWTELVLGEGSGCDDATCSHSADSAHPSVAAKAEVPLEMSFEEAIPLMLCMLAFLRTPPLFLCKSWSMPGCSLGSSDGHTARALPTQCGLA